MPPSARDHAPRRILLAPDSFKESLASPEVARAMAQGCRAAAGGDSGGMDIDECPVADGGEGTLAVLAAAGELTIRENAVSGPLGEQEGVSATWAQEGSMGGRAILELAQVAGLELVAPGQRDPERTTTHGLGELMALAAAGGVSEVVIGLGGSATVDGGLGALAALGVQFRDSNGELLQPPLSGRHLGKVASWEVPDGVREQWARIRLRLAVDVPEATLLGSNGAARIFGPQKGADPAAVERLDAGMAAWAAVVGGDPLAPGCGAAGGVPFGLATMLGATIESGVDVVLDAVGFEDRCRRASLVLTGEGKLDAQSRLGKAPITIAERALALGVPTAAVVGRREKAFGAEAPFGRIESLEEHLGLDQAMSRPAESIATVTRTLLERV